MPPARSALGDAARRSRSLQGAQDRRRLLGEDEGEVVGPKHLESSPNRLSFGADVDDDRWHLVAGDSLAELRRSVRVLVGSVED